MNYGLPHLTDVISNALLADKISRGEGHLSSMRWKVCEMAASFGGEIRSRKMEELNCNRRKARANEKAKVPPSENEHGAPVEARHTG
jgi:hypothetical protein